MNEEDAKQLDVDDRARKRGLYAQGMRPHAAIAPAYRLPGPLPLSIIDPCRSSSHHPLGVGRNYFY